ncbi:unnamed protein product [marine sediment metagenome]|uniref:Uncharacterized protein n=1 Tax=marine sediment metagenome TaxID=412755 RepID=X1DBG1_9ZZZZ
MLSQLILSQFTTSRRQMKGLTNIDRYTRAAQYPRQALNPLGAGDTYRKNRDATTHGY